MADKIDYIKDRRGRKRFPITHEKGVRDSQWVRLEEKLNGIELGKQDALVSGENIKTIGGQSILGEGNIPVGDANAVKYDSQSLTEAQKEQARTNIGAASSAEVASLADQKYEGPYASAAELPEASAQTMGAIYLVGPDANDEYERKITELSNGSYSWVSLGTTAITLSDYATKEEVTELEHKKVDLAIGNNLLHTTPKASTILSNTGTLITSSTYSSYCTTEDFYPVEPSTQYSNSVQGLKFRKWAFYDADKVFISVGEQANTLTTPANAAFVRISFTAANGYFMLAKSATPIPYEPYNPIYGYISGLMSQLNTNDANTDEIRSIAVFSEDLQDSITPVSNSYVKYADGSIVTGAGLGNGWRRYDIPKTTFGNNKYIRVFAGADGNTPAAIAFYSGVPSDETYIASASVQFSSPYTGKWYTAVIPDNAEYIVITNGTTYASAKIALIDIPAIPVLPDYSYLGAIAEDVDVISNATRTENSYTRYSDGAQMSAGLTSYCESYTLEVPSGATMVRAFVAFNDTVPSSVAFFSGTPGAGTYIKSASVQASTPLNGHWYNVPIPENAKYIVVSNQFVILPSPSFHILNVPLYNDNAEKIEKKPNFVKNPLVGKPYLYHYNPIGFIKDEDGNKMIGGESLDDIRVASRLGFDYIEANLHETSDGVVICTHGASGFGPEFIDLSTGLQPEGQINTFTYDYIREYIRYDSHLDKYKTTIPTIDEFLECAKANNIGVLLGIAVISDWTGVLEKANTILGDNYIVYGTGNWQRGNIRGYCLNWFNDNVATYDSIVARMKSLGTPAICSLGPTTIGNLETANKLDDLVLWLHQNGFLVATAYLSEAENREILAKGFDWISANYEVNPFHGNNIVVDINDPNPDWTLSDGILSDGVLSLQNGGSVTIGTNTRIGLGKGMLKIRFSGTIIVNFGSQGNREITSTGDEDIIITDHFFMRKEKIVITATAATTIYDLNYQTSKC